MTQSSNGLPVMSINEVGIDEGDVADRAPLVDHRLGRRRRGRPGPRPVLVCHHFRADLLLQTSKMAFQSQSKFVHRSKFFINAILNVKTQFPTLKDYFPLSVSI